MNNLITRCWKYSNFRQLSITLATRYASAGATYKLRDYQEDAVESVLNAVKNGTKRPAVVLATGGGKTVVMSHLIPRLPSSGSRHKTLVLAHKAELVRQTAHTIRSMNPELLVDIDMLKLKPKSDSDVVVGSVPTLVRLTRLQQYDPLLCKTIIIDECHHATALSWMKILDYFEALNEDSAITVVGFTATLERADGTALSGVFQDVVYDRNLLTMIENRELCDVRFSQINTDVNIDNVQTRMGDFEVEALLRAVNNTDTNLQITRAYLQLAREHGWKTTLVFCVNIEHCRTLCGVFQANGINAQYVTGETVKHERQAILEDFKAGKISILCNVLVFTEGTDIPNVDLIILARPTKSRPLLTQMVGRGLRLHKDKDVCHIVDIANTMRVGVLSIPRLFGLPEAHLFHRKSIQDLTKEKEELDQDEALRKAEERNAGVQEIYELQQHLDGLALRFDVIEGFANLLENRKSDSSSVSRLFTKSRLEWVRLEYDVWGCEPPIGLQRFFTVERVEDSETFRLYSNTHVSGASLQAHNFKFPRIFKSLVNEGDPTFLIGIAESTQPRQPPALDKAATPKQTSMLLLMLRKRVVADYGPDSEQLFRDRLTQLSMLECSRLIFAAKFSRTSLYVKWRTKEMLGLPPKLQAKVDREAARLARKKRVLEELHNADTGEANSMKQV